jgi:molecular chaperone HtpG
MSDNKVGAGILNIITESLYDNPIVVFREYVQNSMDSILKSESGISDCEIRIWNSGRNLFFLDNGNGVKRENFKDEMIKIGASSKKKQRNLGYKGIGRLSGVPYCKELFFVNIYDYTNKKAQIYKINSEGYDKIKNDEKYSNLSFVELMEIIGHYQEEVDISVETDIYSELKRYNEMFKNSNSGFMVLLRDISMVLNNTIENEGFFQELQWLLPVDFYDDLYNSDKSELFKELTTDNIEGVMPARHCKIYYNDTPIFRPIKREMLRDYVCKNNFKYAVGFHTFKGDKIVIDKNNSFSGIRIYIDNMLLCDENELLQSLDHYGLLAHTSNGQLQSVRGIGAMIYITDKVNISANARRTFIEVTDNDSLEFLKMLAEFVNTIYDTRYALSNYISAKSKQQAGQERLQQLRTIALDNLRKLAKENVELASDEEENKNDFANMSITEKKKTIKKEISANLNLKLKEYIKQLDVLELENAFRNFVDWLK